MFIASKEGKREGCSGAQDFTNWGCVLAQATWRLEDTAHESLVKENPKTYFVATSGNSERFSREGHMQWTAHR